MATIADVVALRPKTACASAYHSQQGNGLSIVFCQNGAGCKGPHKNGRKQWDNAGYLIKKAKRP